MLCPNCGYNNQPNNRFCVRCGIDIAAPPSPETPSFDVTAPNDPATGAGPTTSAPTAPTPPPPAGAPTAPNPWGAPPPATAWGTPASAPPPPPPPSAWGTPGQAPPPPPPPGSVPGAMPPPNPFAPPPPIAAPGAYPPPGAYGQYGMYPPGFAPPSTNGLAIASLILGLVGWVPCGIGSVVGVILGFVARTQIRESRGRQGGDGLALAGIILGFIGIGLIVLFFVLGATVGSSSSS